MPNFSKVIALCLVSLFATKTNALPSLPEPVTNNAVAQITLNGDDYLLSFMGLAEGKTYKDVHNKAWVLKLGNQEWQRLPDVPSSLPLKGRLASIAVGVAEKAYLFGGYTVAQDHTEISSPDNFVFDLKSKSYSAIATTPVPTDDAIALVYQNRFIYLISGWHNDGNVNLVQIYDIQTNTWQQASPFLGAPVFGHAGGIVDNKMLVCDGVKVVPLADRRRTFAAETACYLGAIAADNPTKIDWRIVSHPTGKARYRMAATGVTSPQKAIVFAGGSINPYNYNGIGYNRIPSEPTSEIWIYDISSDSWNAKKNRKATMDHRGLLLSSGGKSGFIVGGMVEKQHVTSEVFEISIVDLF